MASYYAQADDTLFDHPKTTRLVRLLRIHRAQAVGHLIALWNWAMSNAQDGDLHRFSARDVSDGARWTDRDDFSEDADARAEAFCRALLECRCHDGGHGFLECVAPGHSVIHDWAKYGGRVIEKRRSEAERKRLVRESRGSAAGSAADSDDQYDVHSEDVRGMSAGHPQDVNGTSSRAHARETRLDQTRLEDQETETAQAPVGLNGKVSKRKPLTPLPPDFTVTDEMRRLATEKYPGLDIDRQTERFKTRCLRDDARYRDWPAAWRTHMDRAEEWSPPPNRNGTNDRAVAAPAPLRYDYKPDLDLENACVYRPTSRQSTPPGA